MSKEREDYTQSEVEQAVIQGYNAGYKAATAHYQPLLDAKDAEIAEAKKYGETMERIVDEQQEVLHRSNVGLGEALEENITLKATLEQAREVLAIIRDGARNQTAFSGMSWQQIEKIAVDTLAAINAATGEK